MEEFTDLLFALRDLILGTIQLIPVVLTWPVVILILGLVFRKQIGELLANNLGKRIDIPDPQERQIVKQTIPEPIRYQTERPTTTQMHQSLGQAYTIKGSYDEAISQYHYAIKNDPENASAYLGLGGAYHKKGLYKEAIQALEKAVEIKPYWADARCNLAAAYSLASMHEKAIEEFHQAIKINNNYANAHFGLGIAYISAKLFDQAAGEIEILKELEPVYAQKLTQTLEDAKAVSSQT